MITMLITCGSSELFFILIFTLKFSGRLWLFIKSTAQAILCWYVVQEKLSVCVECRL